MTFFNTRPIIAGEIFSLVRQVWTDGGRRTVATAITPFIRVVMRAAGQPAPTLTLAIFAYEYQHE